MSSDINIYLSDDKTVLDLTGNQLKDLNDIHLPDALVELDLTTNRLRSVLPDINHLPQLRKLSLRQNLLDDDSMLELEELKSRTCLTEIVLRDNLLKSVPPIRSLSTLSVLDLSYNQISHMSGLGEATKNLKELYLANNSIQEINEISHLTELKLLELGSNKIREMRGLDSLLMLEEIWLGRNKIRKVNLLGLSNLKKISLQSNRLTSMKGFEHCKELRELYLSHNGISQIEGLEGLEKLQVLDLAANKISQVKGLDDLTRLEDLWLNDNFLESLDELVRALKGPKASLTTLYIERNPCANEENYAEKLSLFFPKIQQIDGCIFS